jgi:hypothetical protein
MNIDATSFQLCMGRISAKNTVYYGFLNISWPRTKGKSKKKKKMIWVNKNTIFHRGEVNEISFHSYVVFERPLIYMRHSTAKLWVFLCNKTMSDILFSGRVSHIYKHLTRVRIPEPYKTKYTYLSGIVSDIYKHLTRVRIPAL